MMKHCPLLSFKTDVLVKSIEKECAWWVTPNDDSKQKAACAIVLNLIHPMMFYNSSSEPIIPDTPLTYLRDNQIAQERLRAKQKDIDTLGKP